MEESLEVANSEELGPTASSESTTNEATSAAVLGGAASPMVSKNQLKRQRRWERAMAVKKRRKDQEKAIKHAKAEKDGRDIQEVRRIMEENRKAGIGRAKRDEQWKNKFERNSSKFKICVDCSFEDQMTQREINSLGSQLRFCYSANRQAKYPVEAKVTSLSGQTLACLENVSGFNQWSTRAFETTSKDILEAYPDKSELVYLTSDSENILAKLDDGKVYIIGGIVDRNRLKRHAMDRAEKLGITTAKLPITDDLSFAATKVLTVNHVFQILLRVREHGDDWKKALRSVLPEREDARQTLSVHC
jgi:tRNA (guanine9-N1)-methyltransferase